MAGERSETFDDLYAEIERLAPGLTGEILEPGVVRVMSRPGRGHRRAHKLLLRALEGADAESGGTGWWIEVEAEVRLPQDRLAVPDLAGWRVERVPELPVENPIAIVPDWCCEILSPTTASGDRRLKLPLYAASGVAHVWLVDPAERFIEVYETRAGKPTQVTTRARTSAWVCRRSRSCRSTSRASGCRRLRRRASSHGAQRRR